MSRCFPFPPPGYERKNIGDVPDLLKKEKHGDKKHKKEKRDKDKKEGKEKREKERSDEKHREKKDKKEKHRDKKKDKEKDRDKDKHKSNSNFTDEIRGVGPSGGHLPMPSEKSKDRDSDRSATLAAKRVAGQSALRNGEQVSKNNHLAPESKNNSLAPETKSFRYVLELGRRNADEERRTDNLLPDKVFGSESKKDDEVAKFGGKSAGLMVGGTERSKEKVALDGRSDGRGINGQARSSGSASVPNSVGMVQNRVGGAAGLVEKKFGQRVEGKEKTRDKEADGRKGDKSKEKDGEKQNHKDKKREKEKKKDEKMKVTIKQKHIEQSRIKDGSENPILKSSVIDGSKKEVSSAQNVGFQNIPKVNNDGAVALNNLGKRKDVGLNGIYDEHSTGPNKLARTTASTHPLTENGRSLEPCQKSVAALAPGAQRPPMNIKMDRTFAPDDTQRPPTNIKVDGKDHNMNGIVSSQRVTQQPSQTTVKAERKPDAPSKPPHPDTKYLSQVLSVPKLDEWPGYDEQEWLFNSSSSQTRKPEDEFSGIDETQQVWAKTLWLEPVDVYALPYVIPH